MEDWSKLLDMAALLCVNVHQGQRDKVGQPYFQHPMRVAMACSTPQEKIVALLHDVLEDTLTSQEDLLNMGFPEEIVNAVLSVTKIAGEPYVEFVARAAQNPIGRIVKLHDLEDNLNIFRLNDLDNEMVTRFNKYLRTYHFQKREFEDNKPSKLTCVNKSLTMPNGTTIRENIENTTNLSITIRGRFYIRTIGCYAQAQLLSNGKIVILKGSILRVDTTPTFDRKEFRQKIIDQYCIHTPDGYLVNKDLPPLSPSGASGLVQARSSNGKRDWLDKDGKPLSTYL